MRNSLNFYCQQTQRAIGAWLRNTATDSRFPLGNFLKRRAYSAALEIEEAMLQGTQFLSLELFRKQRLPRLQSLLFHAYNQVGLYQNLFSRKGAHPKDVSSEDDLERLPIVTKSTFLERHPDWDYVLAKNIPYSRRVPGITSGSTGEPFRHFLDQKFSAVTRAHLYRPWRWAGVDPAAPTVHCSAPHASANTPNTVFLHPHYIQSKKREYITAIRQSGAKIIRGYPLTNFELAWMLHQEGCRDITFTHAFFVGHALSAGIRDFFTREFRCEVYNYYASQETGPLATECGNHNGLHIHEENFIIEIADESGAPVPEGRQGWVTITSLVNEVMPFIRYHIGDVGLIMPGRCPCGRTSRRVLIEGRKEDLLIRPDGQCIYPGIIRDVLDEHFDVFQRYQVIQTTPNTLLLRVVPTAHFTPRVWQLALAEFKRCIGRGMHVVTELTDHIPPLPNGKFQYFVSEFWRQRFPAELFEYQIERAEK